VPYLSQVLSSARRKARQTAEAREHRIASELPQMFEPARADAEEHDDEQGEACSALITRDRAERALADERSSDRRVRGCRTDVSCCGTNSMRGP